MKYAIQYVSQNLYLPVNRCLGLRPARMTILFLTNMILTIVQESFTIHYFTSLLLLFPLVFSSIADCLI